MTNISNGALAPQHLAYIRRETMVSMLINAVLTALFFWVVFGEFEMVPVWGIGYWVFDFLPQSFLIGLMSSFVPGLLTRKRMKDGALPPSGEIVRLPNSLPLRSLLFGIGSAIIGTIAVAVITWVSGASSIASTLALCLKIAYAAALSGVVTPIGLRATLASRSAGGIQ